VAQETIMTVAAIITALGVIVAALVAVYRIMHRISAAIGVDTRGRTLSDRMDRVEHQLWPNGGSSLADRVNELNSRSVASTAELAVIHDLLVALAGQPTQDAPTPPKQPRARKNKSQ
jgi:hypothetical protein